MSLVVMNLKGCSTSSSWIASNNFGVKLDPLWLGLMCWTWSPSSFALGLVIDGFFPKEGRWRLILFSGLLSILSSRVPTSMAKSMLAHKSLSPKAFCYIWSTYSTLKMTMNVATGERTRLTWIASTKENSYRQGWGPASLRSSHWFLLAFNRCSFSSNRGQIYFFECPWVLNFDGLRYQLMN